MARPAAGLDVTGAVRLEAVAGSEIAGYPGYVGGLTDDEFTAVESQFTDKVQTDAKGHADLSVDLPEGAAAKPLEAKIIVDVAESGGRTVERVVTLPVRAKGVTIGVKKDFDESIGEGDVATFEAIAVAPDGARSARKGVAWSLYKISEDYQWFNSDGRWSYEPVKSSKRIADGSVDIGADAPAKISAPVGWGRHRLDLKSADGEETSITFDVGWSGTGERRHARQRRRDARQGELRAGRGGQAAHRLAFPGQSDGRPGRRQDRAIHRRRSRRRRQCRAVQGRRGLGRGRLRGRADPSPARRQGQAHARPRAGPRLVRASTKPRTSSTSRSTRRRRPGRASR